MNLYTQLFISKNELLNFQYNWTIQWVFVDLSIWTIDGSLIVRDDERMLSWWCDRGAAAADVL